MSVEFDLNTVAATRLKNWGGTRRTRLYRRLWSLAGVGCGKRCSPFPVG